MGGEIRGLRTVKPERRTVPLQACSLLVLDQISEKIRQSDIEVSNIRGMWSRNHGGLHEMQLRLEVVL